MSPVLKSSVATIESHLANRNKPGMTKTKVRRIEKMREKRNGIIIVQSINIKNFSRRVRDCQVVICGCLSVTRDNFEKMGRKREYTLCH